MAPATPLIFESPRQDILYIFAPLTVALAGVALLLIVPQPSQPFSIMYFVIAALFDNGHVFASLARPALSPTDRQNFPSLKWSWALIYALSLIVGSLNFSALAIFFLYATLFHHGRQSWGIFRWYARKSQSVTTSSTAVYFSLLICLPVLLFHTRSQNSASYMVEKNLILFPHALAHQSLFASFLIVVCLSLRHAQVRRFNAAQLGSFLGPALLFFFSFEYLSNPVAIAIPLVIAHGVPYLFLLSKSLHKLSPSYQKVRWGFSALLGVAMTIGIGWEILENHFFDWADTNRLNGHPFACAAMLAAIMTPQLYHYYLDMLVWKSSTSSGKLVYTS